MKDWVQATLGEVCHVYQPRTLAQKELRPGTFPVFGANGQIGWHDEFNHEAGQLAIGCRGSVGFVHITPERTWINGNAMVVVPKEGTIERDFLAYALRGGIDISASISGAAQPQITRASLVPIPIAYPVDVGEQRRIVAILDEAFDGIATAKANTEKNLQNARELFGSRVRSAFTLQNEQWLAKPLGEIGKVCMCKRILKEQTTSDGDVPFYKIGTFGKKADAYISFNIYKNFKAKYSFPQKGDVLISAAGTIGRRVVYDGEDAYFQDSNIVWIANDQAQVLNDYLYHFYGVCEWNSTRGATISRLYNEDLRQVVVVFPKSHDEQRNIVFQLNALTEETHRLDDLYRQKIAALDELKKSLLHQAFSGQL